MSDSLNHNILCLASAYIDIESNIPDDIIINLGTMKTVILLVYSNILCKWSTPTESIARITKM